MSPTISRTATLASASVVAASALVFGAVAAASAAPQPRAVAITSSSSSPATSSATETHEGSEVYADITVTLEWEDGEDYESRIFGAYDVEVGDGVELDFGNGDYVDISNINDMCVGLSVDVSLDPQAVDVYEDSGDCFPETLTSVTVEVVLSGATFGTVTVTADDLFTEETIEVPEDEEPVLEEAFGLTSQGTFRFGRSIVTGLAAPFPVLTSATASGSTFVATWVGTQATGLSGGSASFRFAPAAAPGATPVLASPVFTG